MSLQEVAHKHDQRRRHSAFGEYTISSYDAVRVVKSTNANPVAYGQWFGGGSTSVSHSVVVFTYGTVSAAVQEEYDPAFVSRVLEADASPNEAIFDNVVDLMDWLERD